MIRKLPDDTGTDEADPGAYHIPVLLAETLQYLQPAPGQTVLDATVGGGGHSMRIAQALIPGGTLIGLDRDPEAIAEASRVLAPYRQSLTIILARTTFSKIGTVLDANPELAGRLLDGALMDLGVSSHQLDTPRGFSFRRDEPLDMRMDPGDATTPTAAQFLATASEREIAQVLWEYGEERFSRRIARAIVERRQRGERIETTAQLAALVAQCVPRAAWPDRIHVATRTFQGIRIRVNRELEELQAGLQAVIRRLAPGGRIAVLSYHSLEDRIVKQTFASAAGRASTMQEVDLPELELLTRKPVMPPVAEVAQNPRARSARLRAARRIA
ncbi:MAG: 16S rRNA (cytosine(1402)-N(4))-methyltransferase RsmH [Chloroherpetonaceae bacterium]|nr:16S rRNA (cytosine(1402)-N(4))-methyltransferase RsmH [Chthonomonadaceae bacterium]MDW8208434.1 16S rRNA (cytosine(1402)-N(4))-methyltransferase RsmH [Chloroherpetonaceae bacterium]